MNTQEILTLAIEGIFWLSVAFMIFQFITGLFVFQHKFYTVVQAQTTTVTPKQSAMSFDKPQNVKATTTYCYEQLPDPWTLESEVVECNSNQIVISSPPLKLLPGIKEIELQSKRTSRTKKTSQPKSSNKTKTDKPTTKSATPRKPGRPRKEVA